MNTHGIDRVENRINGLSRFLPNMSGIEREQTERLIDYLSRVRDGIKYKTAKAQFQRKTT